MADGYTLDGLPFVIYSGPHFLSTGISETLFV